MEKVLDPNPNPLHICLIFISTPSNRKVLSRTYTNRAQLEDGDVSLGKFTAEMFEKLKANIKKAANTRELVENGFFRPRWEFGYGADMTDGGTTILYSEVVELDTLKQTLDYWNKDERILAYFLWLYDRWAVKFRE